MRRLGHFSLCLLAAGLLAGTAPAQHFLLNQIGDTSGTVTHMPGAWFSQTVTDLPNFSTALVDDFFANSYELRLTAVQAAVSTNSGSNNFNLVTGWRVEIYSSASAAATSLTGDVFSTTVGTGAVTLTPFTNTPSFADQLVNIPIDFVLPGAGTYWVAVMPVADSTDFFLVNNSTLPGNLNAVQGNPGGGFPFPGGLNATNNNAAYAVVAVPEPGTVLAGLAASGSVALLWARRRRGPVAAA